MKALSVLVAVGLTIVLAPLDVSADTARAHRWVARDKRHCAEASAVAHYRRAGATRVARRGS